MEKSKPRYVMSIEDIQKKLPHRYPFLLLDRVDSLEEGPHPDKLMGRKIICTKNVTFNEPFFQGHFPDCSIMPGVLQVEAMAQASCLCYKLRDGETLDSRMAKLAGVKFHQPVVPGDTLKIHGQIVGDRRQVIKVQSEIYCEGQIVSQAVIFAKYVVRPA